MDEEDDTGSISGTVTQDTDNDNEGDAPLSGVLVTLTDSSGNVVATTLSGSDGSFVFEGVPPGTYTVEEETPDDLTDVSDSDGGDPNSVTVTIPEEGGDVT